LAARKFALEYNGSAAIDANQVENVLADIDTEKATLIWAVAR
jgi:hypothetical protein